MTASPCQIPDYASKEDSFDFIPLCAPEIRGNEWKYVKECLDTSWVSTVGSFVDRFERALADAVGVKFAVATNSGTAALHVALLVAGVEPDDEVLTSTLTFIAPANAIRYVGAWPVFVDAESQHWQMDPAKVKSFLESQCHWRNGCLYNRHTGRRVKAILPVHILGHPVDLDPIRELARKHDLTVIEDASESLGATYKDRTVGQLGDIACFSFNGNKLITTGGGGMIVTDNEEWAHRARHLSTQAKDDPLEYIHSDIGFNYRLTNVNAAIGVAQIEQLESYLDSKRLIATMYDQAFDAVKGITPMRQAKWARSSFWMYTVLINEVEFGIGSRELMRELAAQNIQTRPLWQPLHLSPAQRNAYATDCSVAEALNRNALSFPCSVGLAAPSQTRVIERVIAKRKPSKGLVRPESCTSANSLKTLA
ncbi:MAG: perosamine synthetase [Blastocatellia bacterium]|nr:perosamine synthetase [Blastocatellia bacterium]